MWIVPLRLVKNEVPFPVERFEVGFDTGGLVRFLVLVASDVELHALLAAHLSDQWLEHLLEEGVLQFVVLHVTVHGASSAYEVQQLYVPLDELRVQSPVEKCLDDI